MLKRCVSDSSVREMRTTIVPGGQAPLYKGYTPWYICQPHVVLPGGLYNAFFHQA